MAQYLPSTPHPNFLDMRRAYGTKISLGLCSFFLCAQSVAACSGDSYGSRIVKTHSSLLFFLVEPFISASAGATPPLYGIVRGFLGWNSRVYRGYEVDIYLFGSPHPPCFVALFSLFF